MAISLLFLNGSTQLFVPSCQVELSESLEHIIFVGYIIEVFFLGGRSRGGKEEKEGRFPFWPVKHNMYGENSKISKCQFFSIFMMG